MEKFDLSRNKYHIVLGIMFITFVLAIYHAFNYLPANVMETSRSEDIMTLSEENRDMDIENNNRDEERSDEYDEEDDNEASNISEDDNTDSEDQISEEKPNNTDSYQNLLSNAEQYLNKSEYEKSAEAYIKAVELTENTDNKALCYEKIALSYAYLQRFGTALSYAQKSYNISPTTEREVLLARLYYKTGSQNKAMERMNNVLKREFSKDR